MIVFDVSLSKRCILCMSNAISAVSPVFIVVFGSTRAVIEFPLISKYKNVSAQAFPCLILSHVALPYQHHSLKTFYHKYLQDDSHDNLLISIISFDQLF